MLLARSANQMENTHPTAPKPPQRVSLVSLTAQSLLESMQAGHWQGHLPGEREMCARLQVSRHTLRAALAELQREGHLEVSERQRRRIHLKKTTPRAAQPRVIAVLSSRPLTAMSPTAVVMIDDLRDQLSRAGFSLEMHVTPACFTAKPARALESLTARTPAAAWILLSSLEPMQTWFLRKRLPCLVVGSSPRGIALPSFDMDYRALCRHAGAMLRRKGHKHIVLIRPEGEFGGDIESENGLVEAMQGGEPPKFQVLRHDGTAAHVCAMLDKMLRTANPPTACVVARGVHALTVMMHLQRGGRRIPQDMAVVSRDDESFLQHTVPAVTRYAADPAQFARNVSKAARQLAETGVLPPKAARLMPQLVRGETV